MSDVYAPVNATAGQTAVQPEIQQPAPQTAVPPPNMPPQAPAAAAKPEYYAYFVEQGRDGKAYFNKIGAAWAHKDGQGFEVNVGAAPVNGRITLRTLRETRMQAYQQQAQAPQQGQTPPVMPGHVQQP